MLSDCFGDFQRLGESAPAFLLHYSLIKESPRNLSDSGGFIVFYSETLSGFTLFCLLMAARVIERIVMDGFPRIVAGYFRQ